jgi:hypothetical protein
MRLLRLRFTLQRMMAVIFVVALVLGLGMWWMEKRSNHFRAKAAEHRAKAKSLEQSRPTRSINACPGSFESMVRERIARRYEHAARYPWLPVKPDPPGFE